MSSKATWRFPPFSHGSPTRDRMDHRIGPKRTLGAEDPPVILAVLSLKVRRYRPSLVQHPCSSLPASSITHPLLRMQPHHTLARDPGWNATTDEISTLWPKRISNRVPGRSRLPRISCTLAVRSGFLHGRPLHLAFCHGKFSTAAFASTSLKPEPNTRSTMLHLKVSFEGNSQHRLDWLESCCDCRTPGPMLPQAHYQLA